MFHILCQKLENLKGQAPRGDSDKENIDSNGLDLVDSERSDGSSHWRALDLMSPENKQDFDLEALSLFPQVKGNVPWIPAPDPNIKAQGLACQKLKTQSWKKIRYKDVQKKLQISPAFDALKVNSQLSDLTQNPGYDTLLVKFDEMAGTISHRLLKERALLQK